MRLKAFEYIKSYNMLSPGDGVVAGVSGGADSMCLLDILLSLRDDLQLRLTVVHVNHGIRGEEARRDELFVKEFCRRMDVECICVTADIPRMAAEQGLTEEEMGRRFRYEQFFRVCREKSFNRIAVAHNKNDNAETVLFNIFRGSGISGVRGIAPLRVQEGITIIRPLLTTGRDEIEAYLAQRGIDFCTDSTNLTTEYSRNRIRNNILPMVLKDINAGAMEHLSELAEQAGRLEEYLNESVDWELIRLTGEQKIVLHTAGQTRTDVGCIRAGNMPTMPDTYDRADIDIEALEGMHSVVRTALLRRIVGMLTGSLKDIESRHIAVLEDIACGRTGRSADLPYGLRCRRDYGRLIIERADAGTTRKQPETDIRTGTAAAQTDQAQKGTAQEAAEQPCPVPGTYTLPDGRSLTLSVISGENRPDILKNDYTKYFDYDRIKGNISLRCRRAGDYIVIRGADGAEHTKSLKTWITDNKISRDARAGLMLLTEGSHVLWIVGYRGDDAYPVTAQTEHILTASLE